MTEKSIHISEDLRDILHPKFMFNSERERVLRTAVGLGFAPYLRGKKLDKLLSPMRTEPGDSARRRLFMQERYASLAHDAVPILPDADLPEPDLMEDIKIMGGPSQLNRLARVVGYDCNKILTEIDQTKPRYLASTEDAHRAWDAYRPKERITVQYSIIPEPPRIPHIRLDHTADFFGLPPVAIIRSPDDLRFGRPFQIMPAHYRSVSITAKSSGDPKQPDLRDPQLATNLDTLMAPFDTLGNDLILRLPTLPSHIIFPDDGVKFWNQQIDNRNPFAPYALLDIFSRAARKAAFYGIPWEQKSRDIMEHLAKQVSSSRQNMHVNRLERHKLQWEWEAAHDMAREASTDLFHRFRMPTWLQPIAMRPNH